MKRWYSTIIILSFILFALCDTFCSIANAQTRDQDLTIEKTSETENEKLSEEQEKVIQEEKRIEEVKEETEEAKIEAESAKKEAEIQEKAVELDPDSAGIHKNIGALYYYDVKDYEKAVFHFHKSLELNPNQEQAEKLRSLIIGLKKMN